MKVRWGLDELPGLLDELGIKRPFLIANERWSRLDLPHVARWLETPSHLVEVAPEADGVLAVGGGSAIDTGKYASAQSGLPLVSVPTTYSGAEWTTFYGIRSPDRHMKGGGAGAHPAGIVYDVELTRELPPAETAGTALNALAHCAEALYVRGCNPRGDKQALLGAPRIVYALPRVLDGGDYREELLVGAMHAGHALSLAGLGLAHAMAQAVGGAYGLPHGAMNALCLPPVLAFNRDVVPEEIASFGDAIGGDAVERTRELAELGGFHRLRDFDVPEDDLPALAEAASERGGNKANPRRASPAEIESLYRSIY
jgi:alcohol dehydrogenase class IV